MYIHLFVMSSNRLIPLPCLCGTVRRSARALSQAYEEAMRPTGLRGTQFTVLQALSLAGEVPQRQLGDILGIDSTTLTRTLKILARKGWISERAGKDRRERWLRLAKAGEEVFMRAVPAWERAQARMKEQLGEDRWLELKRMSDLVTELVHKEGAQQ